MNSRERYDLPADTIKQALDGDPTAFRKFYRRYDPAVRLAVRFSVHRWPSVAPHLEDIVQEIWLEFTRRDFRQLRQYDFERGMPFSMFVRHLSAHLAIKLARKYLQIPEHIRATENDVYNRSESDFSATLENADLLNTLARSADKLLTEAERSLLINHYGHGESVEEMAARLEISKISIYKRLQRLTQKFLKTASDLQFDLRDPQRHTFSINTHDASKTTTWSTRRYWPMRLTATTPRGEVLVVNVEKGVDTELTDRLLGALQATFAAESSGTLEVRRITMAESTTPSHLSSA